MPLLLGHGHSRTRMLRDVEALRTGPAHREIVRPHLVRLDPGHEARRTEASRAGVERASPADLRHPSTVADFRAFGPTTPNSRNSSTPSTRK